MRLALEDTAWRGDLAQSFAAAKPFPLVIVDGFLPAGVAEGLLEEIGRHRELRKSRDYIFARNKYESPALEALGEYGNAVKELLVSRQFAAAISCLYGRDLVVDPDFHGGGVHRGGEGSFLDMHADFSVHPGHPLWIRELNLLLYLNKDWREEYGGRLELRSALTGETATIDPLFNRMVIMLTKDHTFHGYRPIAFPAGTFRTSLAAYAYSIAHSEAEVAGRRTTTRWMPEAGVAKRAIARITPSLVALKQRLFGSATARKR